MNSYEARDIAVSILKDEANQLALMGNSETWKGLPHRAKVAVQREIQRLRDAADALIAEADEIGERKRDYTEQCEQINNLGKFIGYPGCTTAMIVSETVSLIEKLKQPK